MLVYRLEDKEGYGPLSGRSSADYIGHHINDHNEPVPMAEKGLCSHTVDDLKNCFLYSGVHFFAWNSLELMAAYSRNPRAADRAGYYVVVYDTGDDEVVTFHDGQVMFNREKASAVGGFWLSNALKVLFNEKY